MTQEPLPIAVAAATALPEAPPEVSPAAPPALLAYESGVDYARVGQSRWAVASFALTGLTILFCVVCVIGMTQARGWDALGWLIVGFLGNWIGCGLAAVCGLVGVLQRRRRRRLATHALWISLVLGLGPIGVVWITAGLR